MKVAELRYGGVAAWPPAWTSSLPSAIMTGHVEAFLRAVALKNGGVAVEIGVDETRYRGQLMWDGPPQPLVLKHLFERSLGSTLTQVGELTIPGTFDDSR